ncbi:hypothetical protein LY76DRAFT_414478 [Colletotrichum caudatum]|nr:hypothetical protein LY76DRAFT_414478 [Colletotrichum caudatum]
MQERCYASQRHVLALAHAVENRGLQLESHDAGLGVKLRGENDEGVHLATALRCHSPGEAAGRMREPGGGLRIMMKPSAGIVPAGSIDSMRRTASCEMRIRETYESPTNMVRAIQQLLLLPNVDRDRLVLSGILISFRCMLNPTDDQHECNGSRSVRRLPHLPRRLPSMASQASDSLHPLADPFKLHQRSRSCNDSHECRSCLSGRNRERWRLTEIGRGRACGGIDLD